MTLGEFGGWDCTPVSWDTGAHVISQLSPRQPWGPDPDEWSCPLMGGASLGNVSKISLFVSLSSDHSKNLQEKLTHFRVPLETFESQVPSTRGILQALRADTIWRQRQFKGKHLRDINPVVRVSRKI